MIGVAMLLTAMQGPADALVGGDPRCQPPYFNAQLFDTDFAPIENSPELTINNETGQGAIVRLQDIASPLSATIYVGSGSEAVITSIPAGQYEVRVAYDGVMAADCVTLAAASSIYEMDELQKFEIVERQTPTAQGVMVEVTWTVGSLRLYEIVVAGRSDGPSDTETISIAEFNSQ